LSENHAAWTLLDSLLVFPFIGVGWANIMHWRHQNQKDASIDHSRLVTRLRHAQATSSAEYVSVSYQTPPTEPMRPLPSTLQAG
jgi:hypothetical protein